MNTNVKLDAVVKPRAGMSAMPIATAAIGPPAR